MKKYNNYGKTAIEAVIIGKNPLNSWRIAIEKFYFTESSKIKGCPKNSFLGLCEVGLVKGIKEGSYLKNRKLNLNKLYAITAVKILKENSCLSKKELWGRVREKLKIGDKKHNSQMDVVLALWDSSLLN